MKKKLGLILLVCLVAVFALVGCTEKPEDTRKDLSVDDLTAAVENIATAETFELNFTKHNDKGEIIANVKVGKDAARVNLTKDGKKYEIGFEKNADGVSAVAVQYTMDGKAEKNYEATLNAMPDFKNACAVIHHIDTKDFEIKVMGQDKHGDNVYAKDVFVVKSDKQGEYKAINKDGSYAVKDFEIVVSQDQKLSNVSFVMEKELSEDTFNMFYQFVNIGGEVKVEMPKLA